VSEEKFKLVADFKPTGDQPGAIGKLLDGLELLFGHLIERLA